MLQKIRTYPIIPEITVLLMTVVTILAPDQIHPLMATGILYVVLVLYAHLRKKDRFLGNLPYMIIAAGCLLAAGRDISSFVATQLTRTAMLTISAMSAIAIAYWTGYISFETSENTE